MTVNAESVKSWTSRLLLGFVLVTIGFAAGRRTAPLPSAIDSAGSPTETAQAKQPDQVMVFAAHMTFRCQECNQIEWLARELVETEFATELADGRLAFSAVDYMQNPTFARRYNIFASTIVVARFADGEVKNFDRLDEVWTKLSNREEYFEYVRAAIRKSLAMEDGA